MSTLLLRLAAPMQAWGAEAKFDRRTTQREPTKSGVTGLVAAALGRKRDESIDDIAALRFGVRADKPGVLLRDYHTAKSDKSAYVTNRYYLADAVFVAGLEGDDELLEKIDVALQRPIYPLFLGRRSCPPSGRVSLGIRRLLTVEQALESEPLQSQLSRISTGNSQKLRVVCESAAGEQGMYFVRDVPISFNQEHRMFGFRWANEYEVSSPKAPIPEQPTEHDPMAELEE